MARAKTKTPRRNARGQFVKGRSAPAKRRVRRNPVARSTASTPARRRTYKRTATMAPARRRRSTRRVARNPISGRGLMNDLLKPAMTGAAGAIVNDTLFTYLPLPDTLKAPGLARYATKGVTAVALTWAASKLLNRKTALEMGVGALTCLTAEVARNFITANVPALAPVAMEGMGVYVPSLGYYNPAPAIGNDTGMGAYIPSGANIADNGMAENGYAYS